MSETVKQWFRDLYTTEIEEAKLSIANERIWLNGADSEGAEEAVFNIFCEIYHIQNIEENEEYIEELQHRLDELDRD